MNALRQVVVAALLLVAGAVTAVASVAVHGHWWGLALATAAVLATMVAVGPGWTTRLPFALAFAVVVFWLTRTRPEGDFVIAADPTGYLLLVLSVVVVVLGVGTLARPLARRRARGASAGPGPVGGAS